MTTLEASAGRLSDAPALRVGVVCDFCEEDWPSMELVADMLLSHLQSDHWCAVHATRIQPTMKLRFAKLGRSSGNGHVSNGTAHANGGRFNADRVLNRFWDYPRYLRPLRANFDVFHVIDHSYGQVVHALPPEKTIITCHDLDTFQCLINPTDEPRSPLFKKMMRRTLSGFRRAARVTCDSRATRDELLRHGVVDGDRTVVIPNGVHVTCSPHPDPDADRDVDKMLGTSTSPDILHVGSTIPRKRIDLLLRIFARVTEQFPNARLVRVGGTFTAQQERLSHELNVAKSIIHLPQLDRRTLGAVYRRASIVLLPSEREGFGLPVVEAMSCGTPVIASDLPVLREVGSDAAVYCGLGNIESWATTIATLLRERGAEPEAWEARCAAGIAQASKFTWAEYARKTVEVYGSVLADIRKTSPRA